MKKVLIVTVLAVFASVVFAGCNAEEIKNLSDKVAQLTKDNQALTAKIDGLEKAKADLSGQVAASNAKLDAANKELADLKAAAEAAAAKKGGKGKAPAKAAGKSNAVNPNQLQKASKSMKPMKPKN